MMPTLKVRPEGRDGVYLVEKGDLRVWLEGLGVEVIHNYVAASGSILLGVDSDLAGVLADVDSCERAAILTSGVANLGHALALIIDGKLRMYDVGPVTDEMLEVVQ